MAVNINIFEKVVMTIFFKHDPAKYENDLLMTLRSIRE